MQKQMQIVCDLVKYEDDEVNDDDTHVDYEYTDEDDEIFNPIIVC